MFTTTEHIHLEHSVGKYNINLVLIVNMHDTIYPIMLSLVCKCQRSGIVHVLCFIHARWVESIVAIYCASTELQMEHLLFIPTSASDRIHTWLYI